MDGKLMKPKIDFAFKEIMMDDEVRKGFLSAVLKIKPEDIKETKILNTYLRKKYKNDKFGILDVRILMDDDTEIDVEIQLMVFKAWTSRTLFYVSKMVTEQIEEGEDYSEIKKCVSISILDFKLFDDTEELKEENSDLLLWSKFLDAEREEEFKMLAEKNVYVGKAYSKLQNISMDKEKQLEYTARQKEILDYNQLMKEFSDAGRREGEEIGERNNKYKTARESIKAGLPVGLISEITGLPIEEIEKLYTGME